MTLADLEMMNLYRSQSPSVEDFLGLICQYVGVWKPGVQRQSVSGVRPVVPRPVVRPPADTPDKIRELFRGANFPDLGGEISGL